MFATLIRSIKYILTIKLITWIDGKSRGYGMDFVSYPYLILLISGQTFEATVVHEKIWKANKA